MISGLIDELNKSADEWNESNMFELARMCRDAADTIWQLRDDLQRANDAVRDAEHDESRAWDRVRKAEAENAKLRELVAKYSAAAKYLCGFSHCNECNLDCASVFGDVPSGWDCARMLLDKKARELGVEVGE